MVLPIRCGVTNVRGIAMASARCLNARMYIETVVMPASSNARATCPTDTWHTGHVATSRQTSAPSARNFSPQLGAISFRSRSWDAAPTKE